MCYYSFKDYAEALSFCGRVYAEGHEAKLIKLNKRSYRVRVVYNH